MIYLHSPLFGYISLICKMHLSPQNYIKCSIKKLFNQVTGNHLAPIVFDGVVLPYSESVKNLGAMMYSTVHLA